ncbi:MAG: DedA family protein [Pirellulales bacterium]|nr:DedA family protein [Pirellulales bacterium]
MMDFLLDHGSYLGIIIFMILTGAGLPLPEEVAIVAAGILSSVGKLDPWLALSACLFGALAGDCVMYWIGHHFGRRVLREHHWWNRFVKPEREAQMEQMLQNHGFKVLFLARFLVGLRSPVYLSSGILRMPFLRFMMIDLFCATTVIGTFFGLSYCYGEAILRRIRQVEFSVTTITVLVLAVVAIYLWRRHVRHVAEESALKPEETAADEEDPAEPSDESNNDKQNGQVDWPDVPHRSSGLTTNSDVADVISGRATARRMH